MVITEHDYLRLFEITMTGNGQKTSETLLAQKLEAELVDKYGQLIGGKDLQKALGYRSGDAFRQAVCRKKVPVHTFVIENRRGRFALACDIASWLANQRFQSNTVKEGVI